MRCQIIFENISNYIKNLPHYSRVVIEFPHLKDNNAFDCTVVAVQGIRDLFWLPIEQYQRDGRIVRGLQRGANSFTTCTAMAALELTCRIVQALQTTAETAYDIVSPGPSVRCKNKGQKGRRKRYSQPLDIREGVANAYTLVKEVRQIRKLHIYVRKNNNIYIYLLF